MVWKERQKYQEPLHFKKQKIGEINLRSPERLTLGSPISIPCWHHVLQFTKNIYVFYLFQSSDSFG